MRAVWAEVDLDAVAHNVGVLAQVAGVPVCAVVKADGYGHGATAVARAALAGGAHSLAVALVEEGATLRRAGIAAPILVLAEPPHDDLGAVVDEVLTPVVYTSGAVARLADEVAARGVPPVGVHVKLNTGMNRVGADPDDFVGVARTVHASAHLRLEGVLTHLATADAEPAGTGNTACQLERFEAACAALAAAGVDVPMRHAANSAGALVHPASRYDLVRCGIALYGIAPAPHLAAVAGPAHHEVAAALADLRPALRWRATLSLVRHVAAGEGVSYGLRHRCAAPTRLGVVAAGYADGVPRRLAECGGAVLVGGRRRPMVGVVTMDQFVVDLGPDDADDPVAPGDEVVLLGAQGAERVTPDEWAERLGTIAYEIVCGIGPRVPRRHRGG